MQELRRSLPAFKERDALLKAISENQVYCDFFSVNWFYLFQLAFSLMYEDLMLHPCK